MKVILKQDIKGVGKKFEIKDVADGYANNFLLPKKLVEFASPEAIKKVEEMKSFVLAENEIKDSLAKKQLEEIKEKKIIIKKKANDKGHLFEKIHEEEIVNNLREQAGFEIESSSIKLEEPIKEIGEHKVGVSVGKNSSVFVLVVEPLN